MGHEEGAARTQRDHTVELGGAIFHRLLNGRISDDRMMTAFGALVVASVWRDEQFGQLLSKIGLEDYWRTSGSAPDFRRH